MHELMSITKAAVGLVYLNKNVPLSTPLTAQVSVEDALCHKTGSEDDLDYVKLLKIKAVQSTLHYATQQFGTPTPGSFAYNNIAFNLLAHKFKALFGRPLRAFVPVDGPGVVWDTDTSGVELGLRGLCLDKENLADFAEWAKSCILRHTSKFVVPTVPVPHTHWIRKFFPDNATVWPAYGWWVVKTQSSLSAIAVGYGAQFVCVSLSDKKRAATWQARRNLDTVPPSTKEMEFAKRFVAQH